MRVMTATVLGVLLMTSEAQAQFNAIWGIGPNDVWAVGDDGTAAHFTGQGWVSMATGTAHDLRDVWASGPRDVWTVGDNGTIIRGNGTAWSFIRPLRQRNFTSVRGCGPNDVYVLSQSGDAYQPPVLLHYNGSGWTLEELPVAIRPSGLQLVCGGVGGSGTPGLTISGTSFFDPTPQQRRLAGVLMRRSGSGAWTTFGYDGRNVTDPQIAGASWTGLAMAGGSTLLTGQDEQGTPKLLMGRGSSWSPLSPPTVPNIEPDAFRYTLAGDGTPLAVFDGGFARYGGGQWAVVRADAAGAGPSAADQAAYMQLAQQMQAMMARGQQPTQAQIQQMTEMSQRMSGNVASAAAEATRGQTLAFGRDPVVWAPTASSFFVARQAIFKVSGDSSELVWNANCSYPQWQSLEPCSNHAARGAAVPTPAAPPQPEGPADPPPGAAPAAAPSAPRMPSVPRPRIPRP